MFAWRVFYLVSITYPVLDPVCSVPDTFPSRQEFISPLFYPATSFYRHLLNTNYSSHSSWPCGHRNNPCWQSLCSKKFHFLKVYEFIIYKQTTQIITVFFLKSLWVNLAMFSWSNPGLLLGLHAAEVSWMWWSVMVLLMWPVPTKG